jgi:SAM-dependent methyltransferase
MGWQWDESLYRGSAPYYARGRLPYPSALAEALRDELALDGQGRLLDVGCGPGSLTALLAPLFAEAVGIDADPAMVREATRAAAPNARFLRLRAEQLPAGLGSFRVLAAAQSFHWFESGVAGLLHGMLERGGAFVHVGATTHEGDGNVPRDEIAALIRSYLGEARRAGTGVLPGGTRADERELLESYGFSNRLALEIARGERFERSEDDVVASVFSLSYAAPHLFGDRLPAFERDLRALLRGRGPFHELARDLTATIWDA